MTLQNISHCDSVACRNHPSNDAVVNRYIPSELIYSLDTKLQHRTVSYLPYVLMNGNVYGVNNEKGKSGLLMDAMQSGLRQMHKLLSVYSRITQIRLETPPFFSEDSHAQFAKQFKKLLANAKRKYGTKDIAWLWVRENCIKKGWHYHVVMWLPYRNCRSSHWVSGRWDEIMWDAELLIRFNRFGNPNTLRHFAEKTMRRDDVESQLDAVYHWSYLAKTRSKGGGKLHSRDFQSSQLRRGR